MRKKPPAELESARATHTTMGESPAGAMYGYFTFKNAEQERLHIISSGTVTDWEHVSVSLRDRCPAWAEMCFVKDLFWLESEMVVQFHPPKEKHINVMEFCLHLWRNPEVMRKISLPPEWAV